MHRHALDQFEFQKSDSHAFDLMARAQKLHQIPANRLVGDAEVTPIPDGSVILVERKRLMRDVLQRCLAEEAAMEVHGVATVTECLERTSACKTGIILHTDTIDEQGSQVLSNLDQLAEAGCTLTSVVFADVADNRLVVDLLNKGVRGYIPTSLSLKVVAQAIRLVAAGGVYAPHTCFLAAKAASIPDDCIDTLSGLFTARQASVIEALRKGKANKIIAHELNMRESTVKVHVRNIMKKLGAHNRTEVAYRANEMLSSRRK